MTVPAFAVEGLGHRFGQRRALNDVSFSIEPGEFTVLLGLNGAGKTTLFSLATRLYAQGEGMIRVFGMDLRQRLLECLGLMGVVFQQPTLDLDLTVEQNLFYHCALHGLSRREAAERIAAGDRARRARRAPPRQGSPIERRPAPARRDRARLAASPAPAAARRADRRARHFEPAIHARPRPPSLPRRGLAALWATHLIDEVGEGARVIVLHKGEVRADGGAAQLLGETRAPSLRAAFETLVQERGRGMRPIHYLRCLVGISIREWLRFLNQRGRFFSALVRPLVWLAIFATGFQFVLGVSIIPPYDTYIPYSIYIAPGLIAMILMFNGMLSSLSMVYDREMGSMRVLMVSPLPRWFLLTAKAVRRGHRLGVAGLRLSGDRVDLGDRRRRGTATSRCCRRWSSPG